VRSLHLLREGKLPPASEEHTDAWIEAFVGYFVRDIRTRLRRDGHGPGEGKIRQCLETIAFRVLENPRATALAREIEEIPGADEQGESTIFERAVQAGLLERRGLGVGFSHAMFLEHFAAGALTRESNVDAWLERLKGDSGREVLVKLALAQPDPQFMLRTVLQHDPVAACELSARVGEKVKEASLRSAILAAPKDLLGNRFPSEKARGLYLLKRLRWPEAVQLAADWFNELPPKGKQRWLRQAAEVFLSLREIGAFGVIVWHQELAVYEDFDWYEPSFVRSIENLSQKFRDALREQASRSLLDPKYAAARAHLVKLLAMLRDESLVTYLRTRLEAGPLELFEHRALIHLNTYESILLYAESVEKCWTWMAETEGGIESEKRGFFR
jgi:hypothetical protein